MWVGAPGERFSNDLDVFHSAADTANEDATYLRFTGAYSVEAAAQHFRRLVAAGDAFIAACLHREPGALLQDRRTGAFFLPQSDNDWAHTREHRGALGGAIAQPADVPTGGVM